ncbi:CocE/NonD family hydrolase [Rhodococcus fascians]|nr:CocE/NonD family hydrolase [Rhodococcus fascians]MBY4140982.1 CocE/NonD family hydrolase [Rhodococcus fascians]MBY4219646.1 CocE/NonD family hydrolase [Rhodococcus fascians]MBY4221955.1 CocE/NonD family hydrolase [Rhodococcus fascians]MBY4233956.1 CocE/NonD family hydrolase [Rhodococcus fascians]
MTTRDGMILRADVWRPAEGKAPTLLVRHPYDKGSPFLAVTPPSPMSFVNAGYAVVMQDVRGAFESDGDFTPKINEISDGEDLSAWLSDQAWFDGTVGAFGASYLGMTQWALALGDNPALTAIAPDFASANWYSGLWYSNGGAMCLSLVTFWNVMMYGNVEQRSLERGVSTDVSALMPLRMAMLDTLALCEPTPVASLPVLGTGRWLDEWLAHPDFDEFWKAQDWSARFDEVTVPVLQTGGWYDLKVHGQVADFVRLRTDGGSAEAREQSKLVIGPWDHINFTGSYPDRYFGMMAIADFATSHIEFFDEHLKGVPAETPAPRVRIFVMGIDQWREESDWPLPDTCYTDYHLASGGSANTRDGNGTLQLEAPATEGEDNFRYDPRDPLPTAGGALLPSLPGLVGPVDQRVIDSRLDVLCYTGPVLTEPTEVTGFVELKVFVSASTVDTDITAKLVDVFPDGRAINLCDGILRLRYRNSLSEPELMTPGQIYEVTVPMSVTSNVFLRGHRIRLDVSGSNFPHYDRNSNTGGVISSEALEDMVVADTTVHHGGIYPSRLVLPVIDR